MNMEFAKYGFYLMFGFLGFGIITTFAISYWDAINHNDYILPEQKNCWDAKTTNPICLEVYKNVGVPVGDNADLPNAYWVMLNNFVYIISGVIAGIWLMISCVLARIRGEWPEGINVYFTGVIGSTIAVMPLTSWGDLFYFLILKWQNPLQVIPQTWDWLDKAGVFPWILKFTGHVHVQTSDLYIAMAGGVVFIIILWLPIIGAFGASKKKSVIDLI